MVSTERNSTNVCQRTISYKDFKSAVKDVNWRNETVSVTIFVRMFQARKTVLVSNSVKSGVVRVVLSMYQLKMVYKRYASK